MHLCMKKTNHSFKKTSHLFLFYSLFRCYIITKIAEKAEKTLGNIIGMSEYRMFYVHLDLESPFHFLFHQYLFQQKTMTMSPLAFHGSSSWVTCIGVGFIVVFLMVCTIALSFEYLQISRLCTILAKNHLKNF